MVRLVESMLVTVIDLISGDSKTAPEKMIEAVRSLIKSHRVELFAEIEPTQVPVAVSKQWVRYRLGGSRAEKQDAGIA